MNFIKKRKIAKKEASLRGTLKLLSMCHKSRMSGPDVDYIQEIVLWLLEHLDDRVPRERLEEILEKPWHKTSEFEHVFSRVVYQWLTYGRIKGF